MRYLLTIFLITATLVVKADAGYFFPKDTIPADTVKKPYVHSPKKAAIMSACLPGLGQVYNGMHGAKSYWKIPVIYAGFGGLGYGFAWNQSIYKDYRNSLRARYDDDTTTIDLYPNYSDDNLVTLKNYYQRYRDLCVIGMAALYTLQIVDAAVDAHLLTFDVGDNLSMNVQPLMYPTPQGPVTQIGLRLGWK